ncbi:MAG: sporulation protein YqfD [Clostridia bacterium]|nr:sporulation protein YqfD [Clostridia bacterium]
MGTLLFFAGYEELSVSSGDAARLTDLCMRQAIVCRDARFLEDRYIFRASLFSARRLKRECAARGIEISVLHRAGLPALLYRYRHRYGIALGALLCAAIIALSGGVIWDIRVDGNRRLSEAEVIDELRECGLKVGAKKRDINAARIENSLLIVNDDIAWISINLRGTVAQVEIIEREIAEDEEEPDAANLVATQEGEIYLFEEVRGNILLKIGDRVDKGELIVSGIYESAGGSLRYTCAKGRVLAKVEDEFSVDIPLEYEKKVYTGRVYTEKRLVFFEKEIKIYSNCRNLSASCDKIEIVEYLDVLGGGELPVGVRTVEYHEYVMLRTERTEDEAKALALEGAEGSLSEMAAESDILGVTKEWESADGHVRLRCRVRRIKNIAEQRKIDVSIFP